MKLRLFSLVLLATFAFAACQSNKADADPSGGTRPEDNTSVMLPEGSYELTESTEVSGRQGVCAEGDFYWVSGSTSLSKYDKNWNLIMTNDKPFEGYEIEVNHIGDIDVHDNELFIGAEYFVDGVG